MAGEELNAVKEELRLVREHCKDLDRSRDYALDQITETRKILRLTEIRSKIYETDYETESEDLVEAETRLRATCAENDRLFQEK